MLMFAVSPGEVPLWSGVYQDVSLRILARQEPETFIKPPPRSDLPTMRRAGLVAYWLEVRPSGEDSWKCIWSRLSRSTRREAIVHVRDDGVIGIAYFNTPLTVIRSNYVVFSSIDLRRAMSSELPECSTSVSDVSAETWRDTEARSFHPIELIRSEVKSITREQLNYRPSFRELSCDSDKWKLSVCMCGRAIDFTWDRKRWVVSAPESDACQDVPPLKDHPNASVDSLGDDSPFGAAGFGETIEVPPKYRTDKESGDENG
jgi:hypothetical protein